MDALLSSIDAVSDGREKASRTYRVDFERGRIVGMVDGAAAVKQAAYKALITARFVSPLYDNQYGSELQALFARPDVTKSLIDTEVPRIIRDALLPDTRITDITDIRVNLDGDRCDIAFVMSTIYGKISMEGVSVDV